MSRFFFLTMVVIVIQGQEIPPATILPPAQVQSVPSLNFGTSVALSTDGEVLLVGAPGDQSVTTELNSTGLPGAGGVFVYRWQDSTRQFQYSQLLKSPVPQQDGAFGTGVAIGSTHTRCVVTSRTSVFFFRYSLLEDRFVFDQVVTPQDMPGTAFGTAVAMATGGNRAVVGDPTRLLKGRAFFFHRNTTSGWLLVHVASPRASDQLAVFGISVSITSQLAVVGAQGQNGTGAIYIFEDVGGVQPMWQVREYVGNPESTTSINFGTSVAINTNLDVYASTSNVGLPTPQPGFITRSNQINWQADSRLLGSISGGFFGFKIAASSKYLVVSERRSQFAWIYYAHQQGNALLSRFSDSACVDIGRMEFIDSVAASDFGAVMGYPAAPCQIAPARNGIVYYFDLRTQEVPSVIAGAVVIAVDALLVGSSNWTTTASSLQVLGDLNVTNSAQLLLISAGTGQPARVNVSGVAFLSGSLLLDLNSVVVAPNSPATVEILTAASIQGDFSSITLIAGSNTASCQVLTATGQQSTNSGSSRATYSVLVSVDQSACEAPLHPGIIAGIVVGAVLLVLLIIVGLYKLSVRKKLQYDRKANAEIRANGLNDLKRNIK